MMSKYNVQNQQCEESGGDDKEPPKKKPRLSDGQRKQKFEKCKKVVNKPLNLYDLPTEILEKIMGNINIRDHNRIRATSRRMKDVSDAFVMHEFQKALNENLRQDPNSVKSAALRIIRQATEVYIRSGYESTFCGCFLPMLRSSNRDPFCPCFLQIKKFLVHFYAMVNELMSGTPSQRWRLFYTITLMRLIKAFDKSIISSTAMPLHWKIVVELKGTWLGILRSRKNKYIKTSSESCNLLVMLSQMLFANIIGKDFIRVWESPNENYVFGNDTSNGKIVPATFFTFTFYGSKRICSLFRSCLEGEPEQFEWPSKWPNHQFTVNLHIICKEAIRLGCFKYQHIEIGPLTETMMSYIEKVELEDDVD